MKTIHILAIGVASMVLCGRVMAAETAPTSEDRLREALRQSMLQLRTAQGDLANSQAAQAADAEEKKAISDKYEALRKQIVADRTSSEKSAATLGAQVAEQKATNAHLKEALDKAKAEGDKSGAQARDLEATVERLKNEKIFFERKVADLQAKNLALFLTGNEILSRYAEFSLGSAISAKEPFVSLTRTKLENLVQDYQDQLLDQRVKQ